jgi:hypothetical protein
MPFCRILLANENKNARGQRDKIEEENGRAEINAKTHEAINNQENRDQNHADVSIRFHDVTLLNRPSTDNPNLGSRNTPNTRSMLDILRSAPAAP